jgi:hypothetical protein
VVKLPGPQTGEMASLVLSLLFRRPKPPKGASLHSLGHSRRIGKMTRRPGNGRVSESTSERRATAGPRSLSARNAEARFVIDG